MKKKCIGIPRALLYYRNGVLWKKYFDSLGCKVIISPETNNEILELGVNNTINKCCLPYKIYIGHVLYLADKCDYIIIPRVCNYGKNNNVCSIFKEIYDNLKCLVPKEKILSYNIEHTKYHYELIGLIKIGLKLNKNPIKVIYSYIYAIKKQKKYNLQRNNENNNKISKKNKKILLMSQFYNIQDSFICGYIKDYLSKNNITTLLSSSLDLKTAELFSEYFLNTLPLKYSKEMIGALYYYKYQVAGIILISTYHCKIDSRINNWIIFKNKELPILNLIIDEKTTSLSIESQLERFVSIIKDEYNE